MKGKILIVEDEPIVALDLHQEILQMGCDVVGVAESADEALLAVSACRPDLALMDHTHCGQHGWHSDCPAAQQPVWDLRRSSDLLQRRNHIARAARAHALTAI